MARFRPGQSGNPAGRPKGQWTKREIQELLAERFGEDWCPVVELAQIAQAEGTPLDMRVRCLSEVAPYCRARLRVVENRGRTLTLEELIVAGWESHPGAAGVERHAQGAGATSGSSAIAPRVPAAERPDEAPAPQPPPPPPRLNLAPREPDVGGSDGYSTGTEPYNPLSS